MVTVTRKIQNIKVHQICGMPRKSTMYKNMTMQTQKKQCQNKNKNDYLLSVLPSIVSRLEKTDKSDMLSGHDWILRMSKNKDVDILNVMSYQKV